MFIMYIVTIIVLYFILYSILLYYIIYYIILYYIILYYIILYYILKLYTMYLCLYSAHDHSRILLRNWHISWQEWSQAIAMTCCRDGELAGEREAKPRFRTQRQGQDRPSHKGWTKFKANEADRIGQIWSNYLKNSHRIGQIHWVEFPSESALNLYVHQCQTWVVARSQTMLYSIKLRSSESKTQTNATCMQTHTASRNKTLNRESCKHLQTFIQDLYTWIPFKSWHDMIASMRKAPKEEPSRCCILCNDPPAWLTVCHAYNRHVQVHFSKFGLLPEGNEWKWGLKRKIRLIRSYMMSSGSTTMKLQLFSVQPSSSTQSILSPFCNLDSERGGGSPVLNGMPRRRLPYCHYLVQILHPEKSVCIILCLSRSIRSWTWKQHETGVGWRHQTYVCKHSCTDSHSQVARCLPLNVRGSCQTPCSSFVPWVA